MTLILIAPKHRLDPVFETDRVRQRDQGVDRFGRDEVLGIVEIHSFRLEREGLAPVRIRGEELLQGCLLYPHRVRFEGAPFGAPAELAELGSRHCATSY